jgi:hypothetical protein
MRLAWMRLARVGLARVGLAWMRLARVGLTGVWLLVGGGPALRPGRLPGARVPDPLAKLPRSELLLTELAAWTVLALAELLLTGNPAGTRLRPGRLP